MSLQFSDPVNKRGIVELIDDNVNTDSTSYPIGPKTRDINLALDKFVALAIQASGTWQYDDTSNPDYPIIYTDLVAGQRDYSFTADGRGNLILDIYEVYATNQSGIYQRLWPVDVESERLASGFTDGRNIQGIPTRYDKTANSIFLDLIPSYGYANGLKIYINREASYFNINDTVKKPGFAGIFHEYLALRPSYQFAYRNSKANVEALEKEMLKMEADIVAYYGARSKDERKVLENKPRNYR